MIGTNAVNGTNAVTSNGIQGVVGMPEFSASFEEVDWVNFRAAVPLKILIVGAGIAGLTASIGLARAGHTVTILESAPEIKEVGAGIQMAPNATRILQRYNLLDSISVASVSLTNISQRPWHTDIEIGTTPLMPSVGERYKAPVMVVHRAEFQKVLLRAAYEAGVEIRLNATVAGCDERFGARLRLNSGEWVSGDVVIAADGIKSTLRKDLSKAWGHDDTSVSTGDAAYRITIPVERIQNDSEAMELLRTNSGIRWMGPGGHIMAYPVRPMKQYNMVLLHPQREFQSDEESWHNAGTKMQMMEHYAGWNDTVQNLLSYVPDGEVLEWTLNIHRPMPKWVENRVVMMGDSCHPMLPYVAQGAAQAIEDAAVLTICLSSISTPSDIYRALQVYQDLRKDRAERIQASASATQKVLHLPDGPEQEERDRKMRMDGEQKSEDNPDLWAAQHWQDFMWGVDVMKDAWEGWEGERRRRKAKPEGCVAAAASSIA